MCRAAGEKCGGLCPQTQDQRQRGEIFLRPVHGDPNTEAGEPGGLTTCSSQPWKTPRRQGMPKQSSVNSSLSRLGAEGNLLEQDPKVPPVSLMLPCPSTVEPGLGSRRCSIPREMLTLCRATYRPVPGGQCTQDDRRGVGGLTAPAGWTQNLARQDPHWQGEGQFSRLEVGLTGRVRRAVRVPPLGFGGWWKTSQMREIQPHGSGCALIITRHPVLGLQSNGAQVKGLAEQGRNADKAEPPGNVLTPQGGEAVP